MTTTGRQIQISGCTQEAAVRRALPHLAPAEFVEVTRIVDALRETFRPEKIYVFGSQARETPSRDSDVDLLVVVRDAGEFPHHLAQEAYRMLGRHLLPLDIVFISYNEFQWRAGVVTSLPAAVLREGKLLYATGTA